MAHRWREVPRRAAWLACAVAAIGSSACNPDGAGAQEPDGAAPIDAGADAAIASPDEAGAGDVTSIAPVADAGTAHASFSALSVDFGQVGCGATATPQTIAITSNGTAPLTVSATTTGAAFSVSPASLSIASGGSGTLTLSAAVPGASTAGVAVTGSLNLFTNDPGDVSVAVPLSVTPSGATLAVPAGAPTTIAFPTGEVGVAASPAQFTLVNVGNASGTFALGTPNPAVFSLPLAANAYSIDPGESIELSADFTPASTALATATVPITSVGTTALCGKSLPSITLTGQGAIGQISGYPTAPIDFGPAPCGGPAPAPRSFTLTNSGSVAAHITEATLTGAPGFSTNAAKGRYILPNGGVLAIEVTPPAVGATTSLAPLTATLQIQTDADPTPQTISFSEEPTGAILSFTTPASPTFGDFGSVILLGSAAQSFGVTNTGNAPADVDVAVALASDAGAPPFTVSTGEASIAPGGSQSESIVFSPTSAFPITGALGLSTASPVCGGLPAPLPLSGVGIGGGPAVAPTSLVFGATCGGAAPAQQSFLVQNQGTANLTWAMSAVNGAGASQYTVVAGTPPGLLLPGESAIVTVSALAVPSPAASVDPEAYAASVTITTDVPLDPPHVVSLGETPLGDQLSLAASSLRFGQAPIGTTLAQPLTVTNEANDGSPSASFLLAVSGAGASAYDVAPASASNVASGGGETAPMSVVFAPSSAVAYPATIAIETSDPLCAPLPPPIVVTGTGTRGAVAISAASLTFGSDASDPVGLVDCGATGPARTFTVTNSGNQTVNLTGIALGQGSASPYVVSGATIPAALPIGSGVTLTVTPKPIPSQVRNPNDPSPFTDTLTITTDATGDSPHAIPLVMQARGAVIADTVIATTWSFGTVSFGSIGTITSSITNTGNGAASVAFSGLAQPSVFGIRSDPTSVAPNATSAIVGQFVPPSADGAWADVGTLTLSAEAFCAPLPAAWAQPTVTVSGTSSSSPPMTIAGSLAFPTTDCGSGPPAAQSVTLTNQTNVAYAYAATLQSGAFYTVTAGAKGTVAAGGTAGVVVTPRGVVPGPGVRPGSAPYGDDLVVSVATTPPSIFTVPISWALNGAVLALPQGAGPNTDASGAVFYAADSTGAWTLPMQNSGTATATVALDVEPAGTFVCSPATPLQIIPGIASAPSLVSSAAAAACPATTSATASFFYSGPVCQPFGVTQVNVHACVGDFP